MFVISGAKIWMLRSKLRMTKNQRSSILFWKNRKKYEISDRIKHDISHNVGNCQFAEFTLDSLAVAESGFFLGAELLYESLYLYVWRLYVCRYVSHTFLKPLYSTTYAICILEIFLYNIKNQKIRFFFFFFKSFLCSYINFDFLQFYFIFSKI